MKTSKFGGIFLFFCLTFFAFEAQSAIKDYDYKLDARRWEAAWCCADTDMHGYAVLQFRRTFDLQDVPSSFKINVSADNRYRLFVNGVSVSTGPARGDRQHWYYDTVDIAPYLKKGKNAIAALVWNLGDDAPCAQLSYRTGFILDGATSVESFLATPQKWKVKKSAAHSTTKEGGFKGVGGYSFTGGTEFIDGTKLDWDWRDIDFDDSKWSSARRIAEGQTSVNPYGELFWSLTPRTIAPLEEVVARLKEVRRFSGVEKISNFIAGDAPLTIPPNTKCSILLDNGVLTNAYPHLIVDGGKNAQIKLTYAEAMFDKKGKGNRNDVEGRRYEGGAPFDVFKSDGGKMRDFSTLWFRTYRYVGVDIETADEPLVIKDFYGVFTGYPFRENGKFDSNQKDIAKIWEVGWRTARLCAVETYFDCPYYEQLQYVGDTRIQALISLYVSGDDRLVRQAISAYDASRESDGLTKSRYPSRTPQYIPPFSLYWVSMVNDYAMMRDDPAYVRSMLGGVRTVLAWYLAQIDPEKGVLKPRVPYWNFVDWADGWWSGYAPEGKDDGSSVNSLHLAYTLRQASQLMRKMGCDYESDLYENQYRKLIKAVYERAWDSSRKLFADYPGAKSFSQHANVMAILADALPAEEQAELFKRILEDKSLTQCTFYYRFYLTEAMRKVGAGDMYVAQLKPWYDMLKIGLTTFSEKPEPVRSDCHAWSSSPNYHLLSLVCGIMPDDYGFKSVKIAPNMCGLTEIKGVVPHPKGNISLALNRAKDGGVEGVATLPKGLDGTFVFGGKTIKLREGENKISTK